MSVFQDWMLDYNRRQMFCKYSCTVSARLKLNGFYVLDGLMIGHNKSLFVTLN